MTHTYQMIIDNFNHLYYWARQSEMIFIMQDKVKFERYDKDKPPRAENYYH